MFNGACRLVIDDREKTPLRSLRKEGQLLFTSDHRPVLRQRLEIGDYRCECGIVGFERKEADLSNMKAVLRQVTELNYAYKHSYLIVNRSASDFLHEHRNPRMETARLGFLASLIARGCVPLFIKSHKDAFKLMYRIIDKLHDGKVRGGTEFNPVRHVKHRDLQMNVLTSFPGIGFDKAKSIIEVYPNIIDFIQASDKDMMRVPGIGQGTVDKIKEVLRVEKAKS